MNIRSVFPILAMSAVSAAAQTIPAFPGAEGYGGYAKGGRGGDVYVVTNLNASGAGSLREGIETVPSSGRTIVFAVSGYIHINGLRLTQSKVTIAGQTAPGDGVGLKDGTFRISGDDVVVRHLRFRHGKNGSGGDCVNLDSGSLNCVLDSISMQFSTDENFSSFNSPPENLTMQWSLNGWGLESHSCGGLWDQNHATAHHTLWSHNHTRNPKARPAGLLEWVNNVTYDWDIGFIMGDSQTPAPWKANVIGSYFLAPAGNIRTKALQKATVDRNGNPNFSVHLGNNRHDSNGDGVLNGTDKGYTIVEGSEFVAGDPAGANRYVKSLTPFANTGALPVTTDDPTVAFKKVVSKAGALRLDASYAGPLRDEVDTRMVQNLVTQTRNHITRESDLAGVSNAGFGTLDSAAALTDTDKDGMPDTYENALGWTTATQDHNTALASSGGVLTGTTFFPPGTVAGYTRLEEYLFFKSIPHGVVAKNTSGAPTSLAVNLAKYTSGFSASPVFTTSNVVGGTVNVAGGVATFTPTLDYVGRARFDFTVTDSAGHTWTQTCAILVSVSGIPRDLKWAGDGTANIWEGAGNWRRNGAAATWSSGDFARFDDSGSNVPSITFSNGALTGGTVVDATKDYTITGGADFLIGPLTKRGTGTLSITNTGTNQITPILLEAGTLSVGTPLLGSNVALTLAGGTLVWNTNLSPALATVAVAGDVTVAPSGSREIAGTWSGAGTANVAITSGSTFTLPGNMTAFGGRFALGSSSGFFRLNNSSSANTGSAAATFDLGTGTTTLLNRNGNLTIDLGALSGGAGTTLTGAGSAANATTYSIGANGASTTFAGAITNNMGSTAITKVGAGALTLSGASTYTGATTVNAGDLIVNGSLGATATTVASGAKLRGAGSIAGAVTMQAGSQVSPGAGSGQIGTLTAAGGLTATDTNFSIQLSSSPGGVNDKLSITGGAGQVNGTNTFTIAFSDGVLGAGNYKLVECAPGIPLNIGGGMVMNLVSAAPASTRQTFALNRTASGTAGGYIQLAVTGNTANLTWIGALNGATWDLNTTANFTGATPGTFYNFDSVIFDDTSANRVVALSGSLEPRVVTVNTALGYTLGGSGALAGTGVLTKNGTGTLTLTSAHTLSGGMTLNSGTIALANDTANAGALGNGNVTLNGGVLTMFDNDDSYNSFAAALVVPAGATARINADARCDVQGTLSGAGTLNFYVPWVRTTLFADWSAFTGTINVLTDASGGDFRIDQNYSPAGYPGATINLSANVYLYYNGISSSGVGTTIEIGELTGPANSHLRGGVTGGRNFFYRIGGKSGAGIETIFSGTIAEQNSGTTTTYTKTGAGIWRLSGSGAWNGGLNVEQGTLRLWPSNFVNGFACVGATNVAAGATLDLGSGRFETDAIHVAAGATLLMQDDFDIVGDLNNDGTTTILAGHLNITGDMVNNGTMRMHGLSTLNASGSFTNNGLLDLLTSNVTLPAGFTNNGTVILNTERRILSTTKTGASFTVTVAGYAGHSYRLQRASGLSGPWVSVGSAVNGSGGTINLNDPAGATGSAKFYRVLVSP